MGSPERALVKQIQEIIGVKADGSFGPMTKKALINWQMKQHLVADGIAGPKTLAALGVLDTDTSQQYFKTESGLVIHRHHLPEGEFIRHEQPYYNDYLFLHHTAGRNNPYKCIDHWGRDSRGRVATEFVLGGQSLGSSDSEFDGVMVQAFPEGQQGWHLGSTDSYYMNRHSVGLEICAFGWLDADMKCYAGVKAHRDQVCALDEPFRNHKFYHRYSDKQILATKQLILYIAERDSIDIDRGLIEWIKKEGPTKAFGFHEDAWKGNVKGLLTHTNVRKDKSDCFPQPEFVDMLLSL